MCIITKAMSAGNEHMKYFTDGIDGGTHYTGWSGQETDYQSDNHNLFKTANYLMPSASLQSATQYCPVYSSDGLIRQNIILFFSLLSMV